MDAAAPSRPGDAAVVRDPQSWDDLRDRVTTMTQSGSNQDRQADRVPMRVETAAGGHCVIQITLSAA